MMNLTVPAIVFITTNLWGLYGGIPFTAIQPSRSFLDRALGCFQLASTVYTLERIHPHLLPTGVSMIPQPTEDLIVPHAMPILQGTWNATMNAGPISTTATHTTPTRAGRESFSFPTAWPPFLSTESQRPIRRSNPDAPQDTIYDNVILFLLVTIFAILVKQALKRPDEAWELGLLRDNMAQLRNEFRRFANEQATHTVNAMCQALRVELLDPAYATAMREAMREEIQHSLHAALCGIYERLERVHVDVRRLLRLGNGLATLRRQLEASRTELNAAQTATKDETFLANEVLLNGVDSLHQIRGDIAHELQHLSHAIDLNTDVWWELADQLRQYPGTLCDALARTISEQLTGSSSTADTNDTNEASKSSSGIEQSQWAT